jgi:hypothetical protein
MNNYTFVDYAHPLPIWLQRFGCGVHWCLIIGSLIICLFILYIIVNKIDINHKKEK